MRTIIANRQEAGKLLSLRLANYSQQPDVIVLGLPRGGVPIAHTIAQNLSLPLDICLVRKLGVPSHKELAMGAISTGDVMIINYNIVKAYRISSDAIDQVVQTERQELQRRERVYRGERPLPILTGKKVILVDDGIATGSTVLAAITAIKKQNPQEIIIATPIISDPVASQLQSEVNAIVSLVKPHNLDSISSWYEDFTQVTDAEVCQLLAT